MIVFVLFAYAWCSCIDSSTMSGLLRIVDDLSESAARAVNGDKATIFDQMGHIGQVPDQIRDYAATARLLAGDRPTICEVGFNAGHSAAVFLTANPQATYLGFDLGSLGWSTVQRGRIDDMFPGRAQHVIGSSFDKVPLYHQQHPDFKCDLWSIDGDHGPNAMNDFVAARAMAAPSGLVLADDHTSSFPAVLQIWRKLLEDGHVETIHCHEDPGIYPPGLKKGWCLGRWLPHEHALSAREVAHRLYQQQHCAPAPPAHVAGHGVVFSSLFTRTPDNQRGNFVQNYDNYVQAFLLSINRLSLSAVIVYDALPDSFLRAHSNERVRFHNVARKVFDATADRYLHFVDLLHAWPSKLGKAPTMVVFADLDVFFQHDPFQFMSTVPEAELFLSVDVGTQDSNQWMSSNMMNCGQRVVHGRAIDNAGYWGGHATPAVKIVSCMQRLLRGLYSGIACDMAVLNACIHEFEAGLRIHRGGVWSNPFLEQCDNSSFVGIHNKCAPSLPCLQVVGSNLKRVECSKAPDGAVDRIQVLTIQPPQSSTALTSSAARRPRHFALDFFVNFFS